MPTGKRLSAVLIAAMAFTSVGCLVATSSTTKRQGNYVAQSTLDNILPGKTSNAWIVATLGEPTSKTVLEPGHELWKYSYKETHESGGAIFLLYAGGNGKVADGTVFVELTDGVVTKFWRGWTLPEEACHCAPISAPQPSHMPCALSPISEPICIRWRFMRDYAVVRWGDGA